MKNDHKIVSKLEAITPEIADTYLEKNYENNRKLRTGTVTRLADLIRRNQWIVNGASICFTVDGKLTDGQHRLAAIRQSGKTVESIVVRNLPENAFLTTDTGRSRSTADILHISGEKSAVVLACASRYLISWEKQQHFSFKARETVSAADALAILRKHPGLRDAIEGVADLNTVIKQIGPSFISVFFYLISTIDHAEAKAFYDHLFYGTDLSKGHPVLYLRNQMLARAQELRSVRFDPYGIGRLWIKTWNTFAKGERIDKLSVKENEEGLDKLDMPKGTWKVRYQIT